MLRKTAVLVQQHTQGGTIRGAVEVYEINTDLLRRMEASRKPPTVEVFNMVKSIRRKVAEEAAAKPFLLSIGERAETIVQAFQKRQQNVQEALEALKTLIAEINAAEREFAEQGLEAETFTVYWLLHQHHAVSKETARAVATDLVQTFQAYPHWATSQRQQRELRRALYKVLLRQGINEQVLALVNEILDVLAKRHA